MLTTTAIPKVKYKPRSRLPVVTDRNNSTVLHRKGSTQAKNAHRDVNTTVVPVNNVAVTQLLKSPQPVSPQEPLARPLFCTTPTDQQQGASPDITPMNSNEDPQDVLADKIASYVASSGGLLPDSKVP